MGVKVIGAKKLQNGGVVYKLNNPEATHWLCQKKADFTKHFGDTSVIKEKSVLIIGEYIPVTHNPDALGENSKIEREIGLPPESLASTRWIKPTTRRVAGKCTAHLVVRLRSPKAANQAIRDGLIIMGKRVWTRRMKKRTKEMPKLSIFRSPPSSSNMWKTHGLWNLRQRPQDCRMHRR